MSVSNCYSFCYNQDMKKIILILLIAMALACSCTTTTGSSSSVELPESTTSKNVKSDNTIPQSIKDNIVASYLYFYAEDYQLFDEFREYMPAKKVFIMQALGYNLALAHVVNQPYDYIDGYKDRYDNLVLLIGEKDAYYYDDMAITVSKKQEVKQVGIFKYKTTEDILKTVPIVVITDK